VIGPYRESSPEEPRRESCGAAVIAAIAFLACMAGGAMGWWLAPERVEVESCGQHFELQAARVCGEICGEAGVSHFSPRGFYDFECACRHPPPRDE